MTSMELFIFGVFSGALLGIFFIGVGVVLEHVRYHFVIQEFIKRGNEENKK